jgi:hypothetical protein
MYLERLGTDRELPLLVRCDGYLAELVDHQGTNVPWLFGFDWHGFDSDQDAGRSSEDTPHLTPRTATGTIAVIAKDGSSVEGQAMRRFRYAGGQ